MIKNAAIEDALRLVSVIWQAISPTDKYVVVNIAISSNPTFRYPTIPEIPRSFGYFYDKVPQILEENEVICAKSEGLWYTGGTTLLWSNERADAVDLASHKLGILPSNKGYTNYNYRQHNFSHTHRKGPVLPGHYEVLISIEKLLVFWNKYNPPTEVPAAPRVIDGKFMEFLGQKVEFKGKLELKALAFLIENLDSITSVEAFCKIDQTENYQDIIARKKRTGLNDKLKKRFNAIKAKVHSVEDFKDVFVFLNQDGYGLFIDKKALLKLKEKLKISISPQQ